MISDCQALYYLYAENPVTRRAIIPKLRMGENTGLSWVKFRQWGLILMVQLGRVLQSKALAQRGKIDC